MDEGLKNLIAKAEHGDVEAMVMVGDCYNRGFHAEQDDSKAHTYYKMAADKGHPEASFMVGLDYLIGSGVKKNKTAAAKYMQTAADKGVANAQYMLGSLYKTGEIGVFFKDQKAVQYYERAAKQGHAKAQVELGDTNIMNHGAQYTLEKGIFWLVCAYLHGNDAKKESNEAMDRLNVLLKQGLPGGKERIEKVIASVKANYPQYIKNP